MLLFVFCNLLSVKLLSKDNIIPKLREEAKKMIFKLSLDRNSIDACKNNSILFRGLLYLLNIMSLEIFHTLGPSKLIGWHSINANMDDDMWNPADCTTFKHRDNRWPEITYENKVSVYDYMNVDHFV